MSGYFLSKIEGTSFDQIFFNVPNQGFYNIHCPPFWHDLDSSFPQSKKLFQAGMTHKSAKNKRSFGELLI